VFDWHAINGTPGYCVAALTPDELTRIRGLISARYLGRLRELAPELGDRAAAAGIENYHTLPVPFDHGPSWPKSARLLPPEYLPAIMEMGFFRRIRQELSTARIVSYDTMWRVVRPDQPNDVGPVHADKWFWDAGNGSMPAGYERFKIWVGVHTEPGANGLCVKSDSHTSDRWKHHFEHKHGVVKPVLDEPVEGLAMEPLPLKPGDLVMFHDSLLHGGMVNRGKQCRVSIELTVIYEAAEGARLLSARRDQRLKKAG
jgi:hypothetical protein